MFFFFATLQATMRLHKDSKCLWKKDPCASFQFLSPHLYKKFCVQKRQVLIVSFLFSHFVGSAA